MSVHDVAVFDAGSTKPIKIEDVKLGSVLQVLITGKTTLTSTPDAGSYRVYSLQGKHVVAGPLKGALTVSKGAFELQISFNADQPLFNAEDKTRYSTEPNPFFTLA